MKPLKKGLFAALIKLRKLEQYGYKIIVDMTNMICCSILLTFAFYYKVSQQRTGVKFVKRRDKTKANLNKSKPRSFSFGCYEKWPGNRYLQSEVNIMLSHLSANKVFRFFFVALVCNPLHVSFIRLKFWKCLLFPRAIFSNFTSYQSNKSCSYQKN